MHYKPEKEKAIEFIDKFEKIVRNYKKLSGIQSLSTEEIRDAFYNAVVRSNNKIQSVDFVMGSTTDKPLSFDQTKKNMLVLQIESVRTQAKDQAKDQAESVRTQAKDQAKDQMESVRTQPKDQAKDQVESVRRQMKDQAKDQAKGQTTAMAASLEVNTTLTKGFNCDDFEHLGRNCPHAALVRDSESALSASNSRSILMLNVLKDWQRKVERTPVKRTKVEFSTIIIEIEARHSAND